MMQEKDVSGHDDEFLFYSLSMIGSESGRKRYEQLAKLNRQRRAQREHEAALRKSRESETQWHEAHDGTMWGYVIIDGREVHLKGCETHAEDLIVPEQIDGLPVTGMREDCCSRLDSVRSIAIAASVQDVADRAFRFNAHLQEVAFPEGMSRYSSRIFQGCDEIKALGLPGMLEELGPDPFDLPKLESLFIGRGVRAIVPGSFAKSDLKSIEIDARNPHLVTDGVGIYDHDRATLLAIACPVSFYEVARTCTTIGPAAFSHMGRIEAIGLPDDLETIEEQGMARTGIARFTAPPKLREIGQRAFFNCRCLEEATLNQGLRVIGTDAFKGTDIHRLEVPASVQRIETPLLDAIVPARIERAHTIVIAPDSPHYLLDDAGGLYRKGSEGLVFQHLIADGMSVYAVLEGTIELESGSFAQRSIEEVILPDSLRRIGSGSFKGCKQLARAILPESLEEIGDDAFLDTSLRSLRIPARLARIGDCALISLGAHVGRIEPSLTDVAVDTDNPRFFVQNGLLLERLDDASLKVILYVGPDSCVRIPSETSEIAPYALNGVSTIHELHLANNIKTVGVRGLAIRENLRRLRIDLSAPVQGHDFLDFDLPQTDRCHQQINNVLGLSEPIDLESLFEKYDIVILSAASLSNEGDQGMSLHEQALRIIARLKEPIFMSAVSKRLAHSFIARHLKDICIALARHDDRGSLGDLIDLGCISSENINEVIDALVVLQDVSITGYLLEAKRTRVKDETMNFSI